MSTGRWMDAAFEQEHLLRACDGYFGHLCDGYQSTAYSHMRDPDSRGVLRAVHRELLARAEPMYVSGDAMTLWEHARESFEAEPIQRTDLVCPTGFALLPWGTRVRDVNGLLVAYRAIAWMPVSGNPSMSWDEGTPGQGIWYSLLSHVDDHDEVWDGAERSPVPENRMLRADARRSGWRWSLMHGTPLHFDEPTWERFEGDEAEQVRRLHRHAQSFWRLMSQLIPVRERLPRQARRQRERAKVRLPSEVIVIKLRRYREMGPVGDGASWTLDHQVLVGGHWKRQWYPSLGAARNDDGSFNEESHRQIWIAPYVKGPEGTPLVVKQRAFEWDR